MVEMADVLALSWRMEVPMKQSGTRLVAVFLILVVVCCPIPGQAFSWSEVFPDGLLDDQGQAIDLARLEGKFVGLYFSAHWCRGCRQFTPRLLTFRNGVANEFEVVLLSFDNSEPEQFAYMKAYAMPWPTAKFKSEAVQKLTEQFNISAIPALIVYSPSGNVVSETGYEDVNFSPDSCLAAWKAVGSGAAPMATGE
jgi:thioredoxin-related protein